MAGARGWMEEERTGVGVRPAARVEEPVAVGVDDGPDGEAPLLDPRLVPGVV